ncbi:putative protein ycf54 [Mucuna pruriens]|uniref:Ycf54 n=1 Tax=Mucuna pruriens TaxID=157652 RepID=A0A371FBM3_MUCPR|nr:putative protein ycf54 [Mucuna pruriens]
MLGVATLTLGSSTTMVAQNHAQQHATTLASNRRHIVSNRTHSLPMSLVSPTHQNCSFPLSSFKEPTHARPFTTAVASVDSDQLNSSDPPTKNEANKYYFLVANAKFMLDEEEHFQEQLFERLRLFGERNKEQDFWLVIEPKFLDKFPEITKRLRRPAVALVSTNGPWITFMKLRLDRVLSESFEAESLEEALAYNPTDLEFEKPEKWVAPYPKYESGWWKPFLPPVQKESVSYINYDSADGSGFFLLTNIGLLVITLANI